MRRHLNLLQVIQKSTAVELKLIETEIDEIDKALSVGINDLCWHSNGTNTHSTNYTADQVRCAGLNPQPNCCLLSDILDYLNKLREPVERLQVRMQKTQFHLHEIRRITSTWVKYPLFERKDGKKDTVLCMNERGSRVAKRYAEIGAASDTVHRFTPLITLCAAH